MFKDKRLLTYHILSAVIPMLLLGLGFALHGVYPFGDRQILVTDAWQQYYPFISDYWHKLRSGDSLLWSWTAGGGHDYIAHIAYYMASPINVLAALFPHSILREILTIGVLIKVGTAGLCMSIFLRHLQADDHHDIMLAGFSMFYALCAFVLGYYWNTMWLDTLAIAPLVILGVLSIVRHGRFRLFVVSLALAVLFNFYIGVFICIFVVFMFFVHSIATRPSLRQFITGFGIIAICAGIALGIAMVFVLPVYSALQNSYRATTAFPSFRFMRSFTHVFGNFIAFTPPTSLEGLPNLYTGMVSAMLIPVFIIKRQIRLGEKLAYILLLTFLLLSVNINLLDFLWNITVVTNMLPFRFSFLVSFVVVAIAYKAYLLFRDEGTWLDIGAMAIGIMFFLAMAFIGPQETQHVIYAGILALGYLAIMLLVVASKGGGVAMTRFIPYILFAVVVVELGFSAYGGVNAVRTTSRTSYPLQMEAIQEVLDHRQFNDNDFFRTEKVRWWSINDSSLYGFQGISFFSSLANVAATDFMVEMGLPGWGRGNRVYYGETSPFSNAMLNIRYLVARGNYRVDDNHFFTQVAESENGNVTLLRNNYYLPLGFMVDSAMADYVGTTLAPFTSQNDMFRAATGLDGDLFDIIDIVHVGHRGYHVTRPNENIGDYRFTLNDGYEDGMFRFNFQMPADSLMYVFVRKNNITNDNVRVVLGGGESATRLGTYNLRRPYMFFAGEFSEGQIVSIEMDSAVASGSMNINVGLLNRELFAQGHEILSRETMELTHFSGTRVEGVVNNAAPGLLYTSIPYAGNWRVSVNGQPEEIVAIGGAMAGVWLDAGANTIVFRYHNRALNLGVAISVFSTLVFIGLAILWHKGINLFALVFDKLFASKSHEERMYYLFFGGVTTLINWAIYSAFVQFLPIAISNAIAWVLAVAFAFFANRLWVFGIRDTRPSVILRQAGTFVTVRLGTGVLELIGVPLLFSLGLSRAIVGIEGLAAKILVSVVVVILNYILSKTFVFRGRSE